MEEKKKGKTVFFKRALILLVIFGLAKTYLGQASTMKNLSKEKLAKEEEIEEVEREIRYIEKEMDKKDSLEFVEKVAREDFQMVKPREIIYIDKNKKNSKNTFLLNRTK